MNEPTDGPSLFADLAALDRQLSEDHSGQEARAMLDYFADAQRSGQEVLARTQRPEERELLNQLIDGLEAAQRVLRHVWEQRHGQPLTLQ